MFIYFPNSGSEWLGEVGRWLVVSHGFAWFRFRRVPYVHKSDSVWVYVVSRV